MQPLTRPHIILDGIVYTIYTDTLFDTYATSTITSIKGFDNETGLRIFNLENTKVISNEAIVPMFEDVIIDHVELKHDASDIIQSKLKYIDEDNYQDELLNYYNVLKNTIERFGHY